MIQGRLAYQNVRLSLLLLGFVLLLSCELAIQFLLRNLNKLGHEGLESTEGGIWRRLGACGHPSSVYTRKVLGANPFPSPLDSANRSARFPLKLILFACQFFIGEATPDNLFNCDYETLKIRGLALVKSKALLISVGLQVVWLDANIRTLQRPLKQAPKVLQAVRVDLPANICFSMVDELMSESIDRKVAIGMERIGVDVGTLLNVVDHVSPHMPCTGIREYPNASVSVAFKQSHDNRLAFESPDALLVHPHPSLFVKMHIGDFSADESFIGLDRATQFLPGAGLHCEANPMQHEPSGFLGDIEIPRKFVRTDAVLAIADQPRGGKPLVQAKRGIFKDRADLERELSFGMLAIALPASLFRKIRDLLGVALRAAHRAICPADRGHEALAVLIVRKVNDCFFKGFGPLVHTQYYYEIYG